MFWKKRATDKYRLTLTKKDNRDAFRYYPEKKDRLFALINEKEFEVLNISAGGLAFRADFFKKGEVYTILIKFPENKYYTVEGQIEVVSGKEGVCRAKFINMGEESIEIIHRFVFDKQLKKIREKRIKFREEHFVKNKNIDLPK